VLDNAEVNAAAFISRDSTVQGHARVRDARLEDESCADEQCQIFGGTLRRSYVLGQTIVAGNPLIADESVLKCKSVSGRAQLFNAKLGGIVEVWDQPTIANVHLFDAVMVFGNARLFGEWELGGFARIHENVWMRPPAWYKMDHCVITECVEGKLLIDCRCRTREWWLRFGPAHARRAGWSEVEIEETLCAVKDFEELSTKPVFRYPEPC
jgi:hypothetical protein